MLPQRSGSFLGKPDVSSKSLVMELVAVGLILAALLAIRLYALEADPPIGLSVSTDVYTDTPQYTLSAKQYVASGDINPYDDHRFVFFIKSSVTVMAIAIFKLFGVSMYSSNLVGLFFAFGAMFLFYLLVRKSSGPLAAVFYLIVIGLNYNLIFYGRLPFLEHAMTFFAFASVTVLAYWPGRVGYLAAGLLLAVGIFFGKVIGLVFLFPFACYLAYRFAFEQKQERLLKPGLFVAGFAAVTVFWLFFSYLPMREQVTGYLGEQALSLYGAPDGLKSFSGFIRKFVSFGEHSKLVQRMKPAGLLALVFLGMIFLRMLKVRSWKSGFDRFNGLHVFFAAMIVGFYGALMIWNYRPLRYQLVLIYPVCAAAAVILDRLWREWRSDPPERVPWAYLLLIYPLVLVPVYQFTQFWVEGGGERFHFSDYIMPTAMWAFLISMLIFILVSLYKRGLIPRIPLFGRAVVLILFVMILVKGVGDYQYWAERPSMSARDNSRDLGMLLSEGAVLSGPFAGELTLENDVGTVIHMFGVTEADPDLFKRFPITHLVLDQGNEDRARLDYPTVMDSATHILTYHIGVKKVRLFRIAGQTGNPTADAYRLSRFEQLQLEFTQESSGRRNELAVEFLQQYPDNISCYLLLAEAAEKDNVFPLAEAMYKKAVEFSPTNYNLNARLAKFCGDRLEESATRRYREQAVYYYEEAIKYAPTVTRLTESLNRIKDTKID